MAAVYAALCLTALSDVLTAIPPLLPDRPVLKMRYAAHAAHPLYLMSRRATGYGVALLFNLLRALNREIAA